MTKRSLFLKVILPVICVLVAAGAALGIYFGVTGGVNILAPKKGKMSKADKALAAKYEFYDNGDYYTLSRTKVNNETNVNIPETFKGKPVKVVGERAFCEHEEIETLDMQNKLEEIGSSAFERCSNLEDVSFSQSLTTIQVNAFYFCSSLKNIALPKSLRSVNVYSFSYSALEKITVADENQTYHAEGNCLIEKSSKTLVLGCKKSEIPTDGSVTKIGSRAFWCCGGLTNINIPNGVTSIGSDAFSNCSGLTSLAIPESVSNIEENAFCGCSGLTNINIPNSVTYIGDEAFCGCSGLTSVTIPESITSIGWGVFRWCIGLTSVTIPESVTSIENNAFYNCSSLSSITIPESVTSIEKTAFRQCDNLVTLTIEKYQSYMEEAFETCPIQTLTIKAGNVGNCCLFMYQTLTKLILGDGVTSVEPNAFAYCRNLEIVTFENGINWNTISVNTSAFGDRSRSRTFNVHVPDEATGNVARTKLDSLGCSKTINIIIDE